MTQNLVKVFITVKTYPTLSRKYDELVCTAGITDKGKWIRIYPVPFRKLSWGKQYKKYQWIELNVIKNTSDFRSESYKPINKGESIQLGDHVKKWEDRRTIIFKAEAPYKNMEQLIKLSKNKQKPISLATFKPTEILDFKYEQTERDWNPQKIEIIRDNARQLNLFNSDKPHEFFNVAEKIPYKFSYVFKDDTGKQSKLMIEDWEIGMLYRNCLKRDKDETKAVQKVKQKYFDEFKKKDLHLFLGTTKANHYRGRNPFIIIGVFAPPIVDQESLF